MPGSDSFPVHPLDAILGLLLMYSMYRGYKTGLLLVLVNSVALFVAVAFAFLFLDESRQFLSEYLENGSMILSFLAFLLVFVLCFFGLKWFASLASSTLRKSVLGPLDQTGGVLFGLFRMAFLLGSVLYGLDLIGVKLDQETEGKLWLVPALKALGPACLHILLPLLPFLRDILPEKGSGMVL